MLLKNRLYFGFFLAVCYLSAGCAVGPKYERPTTIADKAGWSFENDKYTQDTNSPGRWWEKFEDQKTNELVETALKNNYDLKITAAKVAQAEAEVKIAGGKLLPAFTIDSDSQLVRKSTGPPG